MAIDFPDIPCVKGLPKLIRSVSSSRSGKRVMVNLEYADPFWQADIETAPMYPEDRASMAAFIKQANNGMTTVLFAPDWLGVPQAYWEDRNNPAVTTNGNLMSITNGTQLVVNGVVNGLKLMADDWLGLEKDGYRSLHSVVVGATAASGSISVTVEPFVPSYITAGAVVKFKGMGMNARMVPGSDSVTDDYLAVASFTLVEVPK